MPRRAAYLTTPFAEAKTGLSAFLNDVVHEHVPRVIDRHSGKETAVVIEAGIARGWLRPVEMPLEVVFNEDGSAVVTALRLSLIGEGSTVNEALEDLAAEIDDYADAVLNDYRRYEHTDVADVAPWLLQFSLTPEDERVAMLLAPLAAGEMKGSETA